MPSIHADLHQRSLRGAMKKIADGTRFDPPATLDDPAILDEVDGVLRGLGCTPVR